MPHFSISTSSFLFFLAEFILQYFQLWKHNFHPYLFLFFCLMCSSFPCQYLCVLPGHCCSLSQYLIITLRLCKHSYVTPSPSCCSHAFFHPPVSSAFCEVTAGKPCDLTAPCLHELALVCARMCKRDRRAQDAMAEAANSLSSGTLMWREMQLI